MKATVGHCMNAQLARAFQGHEGGPHTWAVGWRVLVLALALDVQTQLFLYVLARPHGRPDFLPLGSNRLHNLIVHLL